MTKILIAVILLAATAPRAGACGPLQRLNQNRPHLVGRLVAAEAAVVRGAARVPARVVVLAPALLPRAPAVLKSPCGPGGCPLKK